MIAEFHLRLMLVGGIIIALLALVSIAVADTSGVATPSGSLVPAAASRGIPMYEGPATIPIDFSPATLPIDPD